MLLELSLELDRKLLQVQQELEWFRRQVVGRSSEKLHLAEHPQLPFSGMPAPLEVEDVIEQVTVRRKRRRLTGRGGVPAGLPRHRRLLKVPAEERCCRGCQQEMPVIGHEKSEQLDYRPSSLRVLETLQEKLACPRCQDQILTAPKPKTAVPKCLATPALLAHVVTSKFADHLPLNRQEGMFARHGARISRKTLCDWTGHVADALRPVYDVLHRTLLEATYLRADDTGVQYLVPGLRETRKGHLWDYLHGERPLVAYDFTADWTAAGPTGFLNGFRGKLQADAYKGWDVVARERPGIQLIGCMAHARRKFHDAKSTDLVNAVFGLLFIRKLYRIEEEVRGAPARTVARVRKKRARPLINQFRAWMEATRPTVLPKSPIGAAFTYLDNQWTELSRYIDDGRLHIDNNDTERCLRPIAVGRRNWLFAGSEEGGHRAAILYSMVMSCKLSRVDPYAWLVDVLERLPQTEPGGLGHLLPDRWTPVTDIARERVAEITDEVVVSSAAA